KSLDDCLLHGYDCTHLFGSTKSTMRLKSSSSASVAAESAQSRSASCDKGADAPLFSIISAAKRKSLRMSFMVKPELKAPFSIQVGQFTSVTALRPEPALTPSRICSTFRPAARATRMASPAANRLMPQSRLLKSLAL